MLFEEPPTLMRSLFIVQKYFLILGSFYNSAMSSVRINQLAEFPQIVRMSFLLLTLWILFRHFSSWFSVLRSWMKKLNEAWLLRNHALDLSMKILPLSFWTPPWSPLNCWIPYRLPGLTCNSPKGYHLTSFSLVLFRYSRFSSAAQKVLSSWFGCRRFFFAFSVKGFSICLWQSCSSFSKCYRIWLIWWLFSIFWRHSNSNGTALMPLFALPMLSSLDVLPFQLPPLSSTMICGYNLQ